MNWTQIIKSVEWACMYDGVCSSHIQAGITTAYRDRCRELLPKLLDHVIEMDFHENPSMKYLYDGRDSRDYLAYT